MSMIEANKFGTLTHVEAAYIHEMRASLLGPKSAATPNWRRSVFIGRFLIPYPRILVSY